MKLSTIVFVAITIILAACVPASKLQTQPEPTLPAAVEMTLAIPAATATQSGKQNKQVTASPKTTGSKEKPPSIPAPVTEKDLLADVIAGLPTDTSIQLNVLPAVDMKIYYEYGTAPGVYTAKTVPQSATANAPLETLIAGLQPDTRYYYCLRDGENSDEEKSFVTQRASGSAFVFDIMGDSHPERDGKQFDASLYEKVLQAAAADQPDFFMTIGDDFSVDTLKTVNAETVRAVYLQQRQWMALPGAPLFLVNGNHEQAAQVNLDGTSQNVAVWAQTSRNALFPQPAPDNFYSGDAQPVEPIGLLRDYYAFTWGDALFVVIDPYWHSAQVVDNAFGASHESKKNRDLWDVTLGDDQYRWFRQTLENSQAKYKFVFTHHVNGTGRGGVELADSYEWGDAAHLAVHRPGWDKTIQQVMADARVTIFFQGHDHIFARQQLDGVTYQTLPEPANPFYTFENRDAYQSGDVFPNSGRVRVNVSSGGVRVDYIRSFLDRPDEVAFSYSLP